MKAYDLIGPSLVRMGVDTGFFLMGGPTLGAANSCIASGIRMIDVRHEQAAAMMAQAYARLTSKAGICMAASGPGAINLTTGLANALIDCAPVVALGGSSPVGSMGKGGFQDIDQLAIMKPVTKWAVRVTDPRRIPELIAAAFRHARSGTPGPVYVDLPGDVLHQEVDEGAVRWPTVPREDALVPAAIDESSIERFIALLREASRPIVISGSGVFWSKAAADVHRFIETTGIPFYTTPQGRGVLPDDHSLSYPAARSKALQSADLVVVLGTRLNYIWGHGEPPRFAADARFLRVDIDPAETAGTRNLALGIAADLGAVLRRVNARLRGDSVSQRFERWRAELRELDQKKRVSAETRLANDGMPIHPLRLCKEIRDFIDRDAVLVVDGQEILNYGRQSIPTFVAGHRLNSGPFGTMGVGLPFGLGAKAAKPDKQVVVLHGDGSFGLNAMELDTAVRHGLAVLVIISLNGGWTADPDKSKPGRDLGYTRFDQMGQALGCHGEFVEKPEDIRPALERASAAVSAGRCAVVNVVTDWRARAQTADFTAYST